MKASGEEDPAKYAEAMSKVVDGLRGEAFVVAKELGLETIWKQGDIDTESGLDALVKAIKGHTVHPRKPVNAIIKS